MTDVLDIPKLRADDAAQFKEQAQRYFATHPKAQSIVYAIAQYYADEAADAVYPLAVFYPSRNPWWPHRCDWDQAPSDDGARCERCNEGEPHRVHFGSLDSNTDAVLAYSAFCSEYGGGEAGDSEFHDPIWVARREADGGVSVEWVGHLARPFMDFPHAFDDRAYDDAPLPAKPEPAPIPWTAEEQAMVDQVYAHPHDDALRRVLVDHWLEKGDPRGEFGALSFDGKAGTPDRAWLGPLTSVIGYAGAELGRGPFARRVTATFRADDPARPEHHREWATVESLRIAPDAPARFSASMSGLRELHGLTAEGLRALAASGLTGIHTLGVRLGQDAAPAIAEALRGCSALKDLKTLIFEDAPMDAVVAPLVAPFVGRVQRVEVWLAGQTGWEQGTAANILDQLVALPPGLDVAVGHQAASGAQRGLVASARSGDRTVQLDQRGLPNPFDLAPAQQQLARFTVGPLPARVTDVPVAQPRPPAPQPRDEPVGIRVADWTKREVKATSTGAWVLIGFVALFFVALAIARAVLL